MGAILTKEVVYNLIFLGSLGIRKILELRGNNKEVNAKVFHSLNQGNAGEFRKEQGRSRRHGRIWTRGPASAGD